MIRRYGIISLLLVVSLSLISGCSEETAELKQKMATLEKKIQKQETDLREFAGKFGPPKDFSADIQRIEDQQERVAETLKTRVEPVNSKLEEFREWAQEAQKDREGVAKKLKSVEQSLADLHKELQKEAHKKAESDKAEVARIGKELATQKKSLGTVSQHVDELSKTVAEMRKDVLDNNTKLVNAVKKTLPKVKEAAVAELKDRLTPLEAGLAELKSSLQGDRKGAATMKPMATPPESGRDVQAVTKRLRELEEIVAAQKSYLLEMGSKVHSLEVQLKQALEQ
jgi:chromosome segregation ATPase